MGGEGWATLPLDPTRPTRPYCGIVGKYRLRPLPRISFESTTKIFAFLALSHCGVIELTKNPISHYQRIVLVTGPARSGTTLLYRLLAGGAHHRTFPECTILTTTAKTMALHKHALPDRFNAYFGDRHTMLAIYRRHVEGIVANLLRNEEPKNLLFLKDPGILDALEAFTSLFPSEQLLVTIREPAAILASRRDVAKRAAKPFDLKIALNNLKVDVRRIRDLAMHPPAPELRVGLVSYERLVSDFERSVICLEEFLGAPLTRDLERTMRTEKNPFHTERSWLPAVQEKEATEYFGFSQSEFEMIRRELAFETRYWTNAETLN